MAAHKEVVRANKLEECYIRPIAFYGSEALGINTAKCSVHVAIGAWAWGAYLGPEALEKGIRVKTASYARHHVNVTMARSKMSGTYPNSVLAKIESHKAGYEEGILLDEHGHVCEGTGENIFLVRNGHIVTPPHTSSILDGINRKSAVQIAQDLGIEVVERHMTRAELYLADEIFLTGTAAELVPVREVDDHTVGTGKPGEITRAVTLKDIAATAGAKQAIEAAGYTAGEQIMLGLDCAASEFFKDGKYVIEK